MQETETTSPGDDEARLVAAAMTLAADIGWPAVTVSAAARAADLSVSDALAIAPDKRAVLEAMGRYLDRTVAADGPGDSEDGVRDRLFDLLMRRFDALMPMRPGILAVIRALPGDPITVLGQILTIEASMRQTLDLAGLATDGLVGELRVRALAVVYLLCLRTWTRDETADMAATMAMLDRRLHQAEQLATLMERRRPTWPGGANADTAPEERTGDPTADSAGN